MVIGVKFTNRLALVAGSGLGAMVMAAVPSPGWSQAPPANLEPLLQLLGEAEDGGRGNDGTGRDPFGTCLIAPKRGETIWNPQPLFIWQGVSTIGVSGADPRAWFWQGTPIPGAEAESSPHLSPYTGEALQPGELYHLAFFTGGDTPSFWSQFQLLDPEDHGQITAELEALEHQLQADGASPEAMAIARATYFAEQELWADTRQVIFAIATPSPEVTELQHTLLNRACSD